MGYVRAVASVQTLDTAVQASPPPVATTPGEPLRAGAAVGRFRLLDRLGGGGMGVVWSAYDPQLDRKVALKFVRADLADGEMLMRLRREAQALARVTHPNVTAVHDVGRDGDQLYIAQEFVRGVDLAKWLVEPRKQAEVIDAFVQAARGLAAAHAAGIVHRDFKPANVLVGDDGRVRVVDFGLARSTADASEPEPADELAATGQSDGPGALATPLTAVGAVMGTPMYMAPEQHLGETSDARGDQFSFCVALYEALYHELPFAGRTRAELAIEVTSGTVQRAPKNTRVPAWLRDVVCRGLRARPSERFATMDQLIAALLADPSVRRRRRVIAAAGVAAVAGIGIAGYVLASGDRSDLCAGSEGNFASIWDGARKQQIHAAFDATKLPYAARMWTTVEAALDRYQHDWITTSTGACRAARITGEQSNEVFDLRTSCLAQRLQEFRATSDVLATADGKVVERAAQLASGLSPLADCSDLPLLLAPVRPPKDVATRARVDELRAEIARDHALERGGKYADGLQVATAAADASRAIDYAPARAEALAQLGRMQMLSGHQQEAERALEDAFTTALSAHHDEIALRSATLLVRDVGVELARANDGLRWSRIAAAVLARRPDDAKGAARLDGYLADLLDAQARYDDALAAAKRALAATRDPLDAAAAHDALARVLQDQGHYDAALEEYRDVLATRVELLGADHPDVANARANVATVLDDLGKYDDALAEHRQVLAIRVKALGEKHPAVASAHAGIASTLVLQNKYRDAMAETRAALAIGEAVFPPNSPEVAKFHLNLGLELGYLHANDDALAEYRKAQAIDELAFGPDHPKLANIHTNVGLLLCDMKRFDDALVEQRKALAINEKAYGAEHRRVGESHQNIALALLGQKQYAAALTETQRALAIKEKAVGPDHPVLASTLEAMAEAELALHKPADAEAHVARSIAISQAKNPNDQGLPWARFVLAQAQWDSGRDRKHAVELARRARAETPADDPISAAAIDKWLRGR